MWNKKSLLSSTYRYNRFIRSSRSNISLTFVFHTRLLGSLVLEYLFDRGKTSNTGIKRRTVKVKEQTWRIDVQWTLKSAVNQPFGNNFCAYFPQYAQ